MATADNIKRLRLKLGLSQKEFSDVLCITPSAYNHYEMGRRLPAFPVLRRMVIYAARRKIKISTTDIRED